MVMNASLVFSPENIGMDPEPIFQLYKDVSKLKGRVPAIYEIYGQYCMDIDSKLLELSMEIYLDEHEQYGTVLPDYVTAEIESYTGIPINLSPEEIEYVLLMNNLFLAGENELKNLPMKGVW